MDASTSIVQAAATWVAEAKPGLIQAGGVFNAVFAVFHLMFWRLFSWRDDLRTLTFVNRGIVQVLNLCLIAVFAIFAFLSLVYTNELVSSPLGRALTALIALFWLARAVEQIVFFRLRHWGSLGFFIVFLSGALLYGVPAGVMLWPSLAST